MMTVVVVCYDRKYDLEYWLKAWKKMNTADAKLTFMITGPIDAPTLPDVNVEVLKVANLGMDIGALQRFISTRDDYDRLLWVCDDWLPLRPDILSFYSQADLVGTFWSHLGTSPHIRSSGFSITKEVAKVLTFPSGLLNKNPPATDKMLCYDFEYGNHNLYNQVKRMKKTICLADGRIPPCAHWSDEEPKFFIDINLQGQPDTLRWVDK